MNAIGQLLDNSSTAINSSKELLSRLYHYKSSLISSDNKITYHKDNEYSKLRGKLEKKFPTIPVDLAKVNGYDRFVANSSDIANDLQSHYNLFVNATLLINNLQQILKEFQTKVNDFKIVKNRPIMIIWMEVFLSYMQVMYMLDLIPEKSTLVSMYCAAAHYKDPSNDIKHLNELRSLFVIFDDLNRHFIDFFLPFQSWFLTMLVDIKEVLIYIANIEGIRDKHIFTAIYEGNNMGSYASQKMGPQSELYIYQELPYIPLYYDFVSYAFIACPIHLFNEPNLDILRLVTDHRMVVTIFRDLCLNIHLELEKITHSYPTEQDKHIVIQKGFIIKSQLKHLSRHSVSNACKNQLKRRLILTQQLKQLYSLVNLTPGLLAPKYPMIYTALSLLKLEIITYFQHYLPLPIRKDASKYYQAKQYASSLDVIESIHILYQWNTFISSNHSILEEYYFEMISEVDLANLTLLSTQISEVYPVIQPIWGQLRELVGQYQGDRYIRNPKTLSTSPFIQTVYPQFQRLWKQSLMALSHPSMASLMQSTTSFYRTFYNVLDRLSLHGQYYHNYDLYQRDILDVYEITWFREAYAEIFQYVLKHSETYAQYSCTFFLPLSSILNNVHPQFRDEMEIIGVKAVGFTNKLVSQYLDLLVSLLKIYYEQINSLSIQYQPIEVMNRIHRSYLARQQGKSHQQEAMPGEESHESSRVFIRKSIVIYEHLMMLLNSMVSLPSLNQTLDTFVVYNRKYSMFQLIQTSIQSWLHTKLFEAFFLKAATSTNTKNETEVTNMTSNVQSLQRFSIIQMKITNLCQLLQHLFDHIGLSFELTFHNLMSMVIDDYYIPNTTSLSSTLPASSSSAHSSTGFVTSLAVPTPFLEDLDSLEPVNSPKDKSIMAPLTQWFQGLLSEILRDQSPFIYVPMEQSFVNLLQRHSTSNVPIFAPSSGPKDNQSSVPFSTELFLNPHELEALVQLISLRGIRVLESILLSNIRDDIAILITNIRDDNSFLKIFEKNCAFSISAASSVKTLPDCFLILRRIGICLHMRDLLFKAVGKVYQYRFNDLYGNLSLIQESLNPWGEDPNTFHASIYSMLHSLGISNHLHSQCSSVSLSLTNTQDCFERDLSFTASFLTTPWSNEDIETLGLLPIVAAAIFSLDSWEESRYSLQYQAYSNNEHCVMYAVSKLLMLTFDLHLMNQIPLPLNTDIFTNRMKNETKIQQKTLYSLHPIYQNKKLCQQYLQYALFLMIQSLLTMRSSELAISSHPPYNAMFILLLTFIDVNPILGFDHLEQYLPVDVIHTCLMDISLGKMFSNDKLLMTFANHMKRNVEDL